MLEQALSNKIIKAYYYVYNKLGFGFLEKVYENSLAIEFRFKDFKVDTQKKLTVRYKGEIVGEYIADLVVDDKIIIELKTCKSLTNIHKAQLLNYLKSTGLQLGILINFPPDQIGFDIERVPNFMKK